VQLLASVITHSGDGYRTQQEFPVNQGICTTFSEEEFDLLEFAVFTAYREGFYDGADKQHLDALYKLRLKLIQYCSEKHLC
jgi:hypothetical protein